MKNTIPILVLNAKDTPGNLSTAFASLVQHIDSLAATTWQNKSFRLVLFGDYEFQTTVYGLSGSAGVHPCLHCLSTKQQIQQYPADWEQQPEPCTLNTLSLHHGQFMADGERLSKAKHLYNATRPAMLSVPIDHVCLPALHLDLGIYLWVFDSFVKECRRIDLKMACEVEVSKADSAAFKKLIEDQKECKKKSELEEKSSQLAVLTGQLLSILAIRSSKTTSRLWFVTSSMLPRKCSSRSQLCRVTSANTSRPSQRQSSTTGLATSTLRLLYKSTTSAAKCIMGVHLLATMSTTLLQTPSSLT